MSRIGTSSKPTGGAKGECPTFAPTLEILLDRLTEKEWDKIADAAFEAAANEEPDFDPPDDWDEDGLDW